MVAPAAPRSLWLLGLAVLALHLLLLSRMPLPLALSANAPPAALQTRVLAPPEPSAPAQPPSAAAPQPAPRSKAARRTAPARKAAPAPAPARQASEAVAENTAIPPAPAGLHRSASLQAAYESWRAQQAAVDPAAALPEPLPKPQPAPSAGNAPPASAPEPVVPSPAPALPPAGPHAPMAKNAPVAPKPAAAPLLLPPPAVLSFDVSGHVKGFNYQARATLAWQSDGAHYQLRQQIRLFLLGSRAQESRGLVTARGLQPERFVDEGSKTRSAELNFQAHQARFSDGDSTTVPITDGTQDRLSIFVQLGALIAAAPERYPRGTQIAFATVGPKRIDPWVFTVAGPEVLHLPAGDLPAIKLQRLPRGDDERRDELWLGTELHYLPVRIRLGEEGGDFVDLRLSGHESP